jgi:hypothetical protein
MDKQSKIALLIAFGLVGAFILGAMTATAGIAMTRMAATLLAGGPGYVHGGPHPGMGPAGACDPHGPALEGPCGMGPEMWDHDGEEWRGKGKRGSDDKDGWFGQDKEDWFERYHPEWDGDHPRGPFFDEDGAYSEDVRNRETCPMWGTF